MSDNEIKLQNYKTEEMIILRNKKTGEIIEDYNIILSNNFSFIIVANDKKYCYTTGEQFRADWEEYKEPKGIIKVEKSIIPTCVYIEYLTEKEADKAVEKLKTWQRLKDKGLHVTTFYVEDGSLVIRARTYNSSGAENWEDLDLLFSGDEE